MEQTPHHVWLTDEQLQTVKQVFEENGWELKVETDELFRLRQETADEYVALAECQNSSFPIDSDHTSQAQLRHRTTIGENGNNDGTISLHKSQKDFQRMRREGASIKKSIKSKPKIPNGSPRDPSSKTWHKSVFSQASIEEDVEADLNFTHFVLPTDNTIKILTKLSTEHVKSVSQVPVRIVLLVDRSGSMLHKLGRDGRHTKITKVKHFVDQLIQSLDDGDAVSLVTFGEDAEVLFPLVRLDMMNRDKLRGKLRTLDRGSMARVTNLSVGLRKALKVFYDATKNKEDYLLSTKNSILVFTDGDINEGTQKTSELIHEVRQNIRQMVPSLDDTQNQWVTISVVNTGSSVSEQAYTLSKTCSSDAYYYIDNAAEDPEAELFLPVLLRKTAVAWNISYVVETFHDIKFVDDKCSRDNRVRLRRSVSGRKEHEEKSYFLYDFAASNTREFGVYASWGGLEQIKHLDDEVTLFKMRVEFTNIKGERYWQEVTITKGEIIAAMKTTDNSEASEAALKHELRLVSGEVLRNAADFLKTGDKRKSQAVIQEGQKDLQALLNAFGDKSREEEDKDTDIPKGTLHSYAKSVVDNLNSLIGTIESASQGAAWNKVKAVSTAIIREAPNTTETLVDGDILCPFPTIDKIETKGLRDPLERVKAKNKANRKVSFKVMATVTED